MQEALYNCVLVRSLHGAEAAVHQARKTLYRMKAPGLVCTEPHLQPVTGEPLMGASANTQDRAQLDIATNRLWGGLSE